MKTLEELRKLDVKQLNEDMLGLKKTLFQTRFSVKSGQSQEIHTITNAKKQIARIKTILKEKENSSK